MRRPPAHTFLQSLKSTERADGEGPTPAGGGGATPPMSEGAAASAAAGAATAGAGAGAAADDDAAPVAASVVGVGARGMMVGAALARARSRASAIEAAAAPALRDVRRQRPRSAAESRVRTHEVRSSSGRARRVDADWLAPTATVPPARRAALGALPSAPLAAATHSSMMRSSASRTTHARRDALSILRRA